ncbi:MAG: hypothetical protein KatS3mg114_1179 [Planctomycetaceae bacterium]|nr:MAG: hypothetical protein KatS3mg114_1179 [Planctomycetaceae bacterium]
MRSVLSLVIVCWLASDDPPAVTIDGNPLSPATWHYVRLTMGNESTEPQVQKRLIELAIERELIRRFLARQQISSPPEWVDAQWQALRDLILKRGEQPESLLMRLGLSEQQIRHELRLSWDWQYYVTKTVSTEQLRQEFEAHRSWYDGTRVRVRQIFRRLDPQSGSQQRQQEEQLLLEVKRRIEQGLLSFEQAVLQYSHALSKEQGGDVGWLGGPGRLPSELAFAALDCPVGELRGPLQTAHGWHLLQVTERKAGMLSLEDARTQLLKTFSDRLWQEVLEKERKASTIVIRAP